MTSARSARAVDATPDKRPTGRSAQRAGGPRHADSGDQGAAGGGLLEAPHRFHEGRVWGAIETVWVPSLDGF